MLPRKRGKKKKQSRLPICRYFRRRFNPNSVPFKHNQGATKEKCTWKDERINPEEKQGEIPRANTQQGNPARFPP
jgi:hypothetical protein